MSEHKSKKANYISSKESARISRFNRNRKQLLLAEKAEKQKESKPGYLHDQNEGLR